MPPLTVVYTARHPESHFSDSLRTNRGTDKMVLLLIVVTGKQQRLNGVTKICSVPVRVFRPSAPSAPPARTRYPLAALLFALLPVT